MIVSLTDNAFIVNAFENLMDMRDWVSAQTLLEQEHMEASRSEHAEILRMLKRKDVRGAARVMERHLARAEKGALVSCANASTAGIAYLGQGCPRNAVGGAHAAVIVPRAKTRPAHEGDR